VAYAHEAAPVDPKRLSRRRHAERLAQEGAGHDPFAGRRVLGHRTMFDLHLEVREGDKSAFEESLDRLTPTERLVQSDIAIEGILREKAQKQWSILRTPRPRPTRNQGVLRALNACLAHQSASVPAGAKHRRRSRAVRKPPTVKLSRSYINNDALSTFRWN